MSFSEWDKEDSLIRQKMGQGVDSIITLKGGAAVEMVDLALAKVHQNIADINTDMGVRTVTLQIKVKPVDEARTMVAYAISVPPPKLCGQEPITTLAEIQINSKHGVHSIEKGSDQLAIPFDNVTPIKKTEDAG
jgi:hypothetical protein